MDASEMTVLINRASGGDSEATSRLIAVVYDQLRALAGSYAGGFNSNQTLHPTALVHEAFIKLVQSTGATYNDRSHFFAIAATAMRQILTDQARRKRAAKRGGDAPAEHLTNWNNVGLEDRGSRDIDPVALDDLLSELERSDPRRYQVVVMRFFGGLEVEDVARMLGVSRSTVEADWRAARAWLSMMLASS
jgi:RNA polymerase sigma factor (TIGR02999 family)